ncbi:indole-3-glycerol phosphate synthase TrpC [Bacillus sp. FJAT-45037]|uniref:indole-3-glycerol phosphate synthase TrpC n=1 Tax=Bacillus sp. FJAT-45037 TaxID=2011007 RepID=UPI000C23592A|nr:indole-3-glycerol phosphate synthase TrpC [Bacillus sp. FJAT-45037]
MLNTIIQTKKEELHTLELPPVTSVERKSLFHALSMPNRSVGLIAEVKKASPSKGLIREDFDPVAIAKEYEQSGADAISVLTDQVYFKGHRDYLRDIKQTVQLPILRKDFIIDQKQIEESVRIGADAILLIAGIMPNEALKKLYDEAVSSGLECLVEVHEEEELTSLLKVFTPQIIGVNNRNLKTFKTDLKQTGRMGALVPIESVFVSESGIHTHADLSTVKEFGAQAVLVGESLMRAKTPTIGIQSLFGGEFLETSS